MKKIIFFVLLIFVIVAGFIIFSSYQEVLSSTNDEGKLEPIRLPWQKSSYDVQNKTIRIVSLAPNLTEILFALGLDKKIVAVSSDSDFPAAAAKKKKVGTFWQPNTEAIIAARPDLVVTLWFEQQKAAANTLSRLGYKVLTLRIERVDELFTSIKKIGTASDCEQRSKELVKNIENQIDNLNSRFNSAQKVRVLWVVQPEPLLVVGRNTFINELIEMVGGENAIGPTVQQYPPIGSEEILLCGADVIIQSAMGTSKITEQQQASEKFWSKWPNLPAVKNKKIYVIDADTTLRLGPRLPAGIEQIGRCLHPEIFK